MASRLPKILFFFLLLPIALGVSGWQGWAWWSWATAPIAANAAPTAAEAPAPATDTVQIQIPPGTSGQQIGQDLEAAGLIRSHLAWNLWSRWQNLRRDDGYQAGTYVLSPTQSMQDIAQQIRTGDVLQTSFTIPEGWTREQMAAAFEERGFFSAQGFLEATQQQPRDRRHYQRQQCQRRPARIGGVQIDQAHGQSPTPQPALPGLVGERQAN